MDLSSDKGSIEASASNIEDDGKISRPKSCADCQTTKTPLWRGGPSGPKSLCNACGIRYQKTRKGSTGLKEEKQKKRRKKEKRMEEKMEMAFKLRLLGIGRDVVLKQRRSWLQRRRKLGEEEQAAVLLMALSSGFL